MVRAVSFVALVFTSLLAAQDGPPGPAPQLQKLAPLIGNWSGTGTATMGPGAAPTKWKARGTYRWCLGEHWVQEDFEVAFEGLPMPMIHRSYYGFDRENDRYVVLAVSNAGEVRLGELAILPDGTMVDLSTVEKNGMPMAQRSTLRVEGDALHHAVDMLMPSGPALQIVDGRFQRTKESFDGAFDTMPLVGAARSPMTAQLAKSAGSYDVAGEVVMAPGASPMKISGVDTFRSVFGGVVMHGSTRGSAEGVPGAYEGEVFWGFDPAKNCLVAAYVSNMGEVMAMEGRFVGGKLISTSHAMMRGAVTVQRMVMEFDDKGAPTRVLSHSIAGDGPPLESFRATYTKKS